MQTQTQNRLQALQAQLNNLPKEAKAAQLNQIIHQIVPMFGTCGVLVKQLEQQQCTMAMPSATKVHNQIGSIQSAGIILTAESAMGLAVGMNLPDDKVSLVKNVNTDFIKKVKGDIQATATLTKEQMKLLQNEAKGEFVMEVPVTDETQQTIAICKATWAWFPISAK